MIPPEVHDVHLRLGYSSGACFRCYPAWTSWHADARAGRLRPAVVGGIPIETPLDPASDAAPCAPLGRGFAQRAEPVTAAGR